MSDGTTEYWGESTMGTTLNNMTDIDTSFIGENSDGKRIIGVDYTGKQVNMNFWESTLYEGTYALNDMLSLTSENDADFTPGYIADEDGDGEIDINENGSIKGEVPQYIKLENGTSWIAVTNLAQTFRYLSNLTISPVIPETAITLEGTFCDTDIIETKTIPKGNVNNLRKKRCNYFFINTLLFSFLLRLLKKDRNNPNIYIFNFKNLFCSLFYTCYLVSILLYYFFFLF